MTKKKSASKQRGRRIPSRPERDWRGETLAQVRNVIKEADPDVVETVKWRKPSNAMRGVPVWEHAGIVCTGETYKTVVSRP